MKILQNEINGTQTSFSTNSGGKLRFIESFLFPELLNSAATYIFTGPLYKYYDYSRTLCIKCRIPAFHIKI